MIKLQFVRGPDLASAAIAWFSAGPYSHVDAVLDDGRLLGARNDAIGGRPPGVEIRPANYAKWPQGLVLSLECTPTQDKIWRDFLYAQIHKPYDSTAIWGFAVNRDWRKSDSWFCSELQARALEVCGVCPVLAAPVSKITPTSLAVVMSALGAK